MASNATPVDRRSLRAVGRRQRAWRLGLGRIQAPPLQLGQLAAHVAAREARRPLAVERRARRDAVKAQMGASSLKVEMAEQEMRRAVVSYTRRGIEWSVQKVASEKKAAFSHAAPAVVLLALTQSEVHIHLSCSDA